MTGLVNHSKWPALAVACIGLAACGGGTKTASIPSGNEKVAPSASVDTGTTETTPAKAPTFAKPTAEVKKLADGVGTATKKRPKLAKPSGKPPTKLTVVDLVKGTGAGAQDGSALTVDYDGWSWSTGKEFDASWKTGNPFPVTLGQNSVIKGWEQGLIGMKQGGRRMLVIPPELGYGSQGSPPAIKPNETLVFVIDLRKKA